MKKTATNVRRYLIISSMLTLVVSGHDCERGSGRERGNYGEPGDFRRCDGHRRGLDCPHAGVYARVSARCAADYRFFGNHMERDYGQVWNNRQRDRIALYLFEHRQHNAVDD